MRHYLRLSGIILGISLIWEFTHAGLYIDHTGIERTAHLIIAALADLVLVLSILLIDGARRKLVERRKESGSKERGIGDHFFIISLGLVMAITIEIVSLSLGRWEYTSLMPTVFGIGLSPLVQLAATAEMSLLLSNVFDGWKTPGDAKGPTRRKKKNT